MSVYYRVSEKQGRLPAVKWKSAAGAVVCNVLPALSRLIGTSFRHLLKAHLLLEVVTVLCFSRLNYIFLLTYLLVVELVHLCG